MKRNKSAPPPPEKLTQRALASIYRQQKPDFSYLYGEYMRYQPMRPINRPGGSLGRSQACNLALRLWGDQKITRRSAQTWLNRLFARNGWLSIGPQTSHSSRIVVPGGRVLSTTSATTMRPCVSNSSRRRPTRVPGAAGDCVAEFAGEGRLVVGLPAVQLPPAGRNGLRVDGTDTVPGEVIGKGFIGPMGHIGP